MEVLTQRALFTACSRSRRWPLRYNPLSLEVDLLLQNNSESCKEIRRLCEFEGGITFTDSGDRKVKFFRPSEKNVKTLMCSGQEGASDGTDETCSFTQVHGICSMEKTLFVSDVATGCIKLASRLSGIVSFIKVLGSIIAVLVSKPKA